MTTAPSSGRAVAVAPQTRSAWVGLPSRIVRFSRRQPLGAFSAVVLVVLVLSAALADVIVPYDPIRNNVGPSLEGPDGAHLFGTDHFGRDVFSRIVYGARTSLYVGIGATLLGVLAATLLGAVSGYMGAKLDYFVQRFVDTAQAIPPLIFLLGVLLVLGPRTEYIILALGLRTGLSLSRIVRGSVIDIKGEEVRRGGAILRRQRRANPGLPRSPEHLRADHSPHLDDHRRPDRCRGGAELPGIWRAASHSILGRDAECGRKDLHARRPVAAHRPGFRPLPCCVRHEYVW